MYLKHLSLANFRNFVRLELDFPPAVTLVQADNAQGKTNLLEAIALLAMARSPRAGAESEWVSWHVDREPVPYARVEAILARGDEEAHLEMVMTPTGSSSANGLTFRKQIRINGVDSRAMDLVGQMKVVLFMPEDVDLVAGSPSVRRRYLDVALCQMDSRYCRTLSRYQKVVERRNALLKQLREEGGDPKQLDYWDRELVQNGSHVLARRWIAVAQLDEQVQAIYSRLAGPEQSLRLHYVSSVSSAALPADVDSVAGQATATQQRVAEDFWKDLKAHRERERAAGVTLLGPHRDDMEFLLLGRDLRTYGSRGQQRSAALSLKLAEVEVMREETGQTPILLLDDVMSELDEARRTYLLSILTGSNQAIVTTTDWDDFAPDFRDRAHCLEVQAGEVREVGTGSGC